MGQIDGHRPVQENGNDFDVFAFTIAGLLVPYAALLGSANPDGGSSRMPVC